MTPKSKTFSSLLPLIMASCLISGCIYTPKVESRPPTWAQPIENPELSNLHQVSSGLYRCALPEQAGYEAARDLGIQTIVNLRPSKSAATPAGPVANYVNIPVQTGSPSYEQAREFFKVVDDPKNQPVLLHCYHGADRTGAFTALYRINRQSWSKDEAIREMTGGGYHFHTMWKSLIDWVREAPEF